MKLQPCHCGYAGALSGEVLGGFYQLTCPKCTRQVQAFTLAGLAEAWNRPASEVTK